MASIIDPATAKSLTQEYQQQNSSVGGSGLLTPDKQFLNGYFLDRQSLESLLSDPKVVGVSLHLAKHPNFAGDPGNHFTLVYGGAQLNTAPGAAESHITTGAIYSDPPPCPSFCPKII